MLDLHFHAPFDVFFLGEFVFDEVEGIAQFFFDAVDHAHHVPAGGATGGIQGKDLHQGFLQ